MRLLTAILTAAILTGCLATEPGPRRVLGTIAGYDDADPRVTVTAEGTSVTVVVRTYGNSCFSVAETVTTVDGMDALVEPYDYDPRCSDRVLRIMHHQATIEFGAAGTAVVRVRGLDEKSAWPPDTLVVERTIELQ